MFRSTIRNRNSLAGKFTHIRLSVNVTQLPGNNGEDWAWDGTYSFDPRD